MAIHQIKTQTDLEKRLQQLRRQTYGGKTVAGNKYQVAGEQNQTTNYQLPTTDLTYLKHDLTKIATMSVIALGIQFLLYFAINHNLIKLPF